MRTRLFGLLLSAAALAACAHEAPEPIDNTPVTGKMARTDKAFVRGDPETRHRCRADADCPTGDLCLPDQSVCISSYPEPRMLEVSFGMDRECKLVNIYFPYDSAELVPEAQHWLEYNLRCLKARGGAHGVLLEAFCDARGSQAYNLKLSERRGDYVKVLLQQQGLDLPIEVLGEGKRHPIRAGTSEQDYAFNRRVEFTVVQ